MCPRVEHEELSALIVGRGNPDEMVSVVFNDGGIDVAGVDVAKPSLQDSRVARFRMVGLVNGRAAGEQPGAEDHGHLRLAETTKAIGYWIVATVGTAGGLVTRTIAVLLGAWMIGGCPAPNPTSDAPLPTPNPTGDSGAGSTTPTDAPTGDWTWANPVPQGASILRIDWVTNDVAFALTSGGGVLRSTDGGASWHARYGIQRLGYGLLNALSFADADHGWAVGDQGRIVHTADGGATWVTQTPEGFAFTLEDVQFTSPQHGVAVGATGRILHTADGGATWTEPTHSAGTTFFRAVVLASDQVGWVGGRDGTVLSTADGGLTWEPVVTSFDDDIMLGSPAGPSGVAFSTRRDVHVFDGTSWSTPIQVDGGIEDLAYTSPADGSLLYFDEGVLRLAEVEGGQLDIQDLSLEPAPRALARRGDQVLLGGWSGALYRSTDGGGSFASLTTRLPVTLDIQLLDVSFAGEQGVAVGLAGAVLTTDDGGRTWVPQTSGTTVDLRSVWVVEQTAVAVGYENGPDGRTPHVFVSGDAGVTWAPGTLPDREAFLDDVAMWTAQRGIAVGGTSLGDEIIFITEDGGATWVDRSRDPGTAGFVGLHVWGTDHAWLGAGFGPLGPHHGWGRHLRRGGHEHVAGVRGPVLRGLDDGLGRHGHADLAPHYRWRQHLDGHRGHRHPIRCVVRQCQRGACRGDQWGGVRHRGRRRHVDAASSGMVHLWGPDPGGRRLVGLRCGDRGVGVADPVHLDRRGPPAVV